MVAIGQLLDRRYLITQILGTGGFGQTYLAEDTKRPGSPDCVVKQLWLSHSSPHTVQIARRLFEKEAEVLEKLGQNDQIPRLLAHFEEDNQFYLVEEYILGQSLTEEIIPGRSLNETQVIILLTQILEILAFVHSHRVIHRDIKPANLIKRIDNKIVLIDFGAVKEISSQLHQGQINLTIAIGTPPDMPIEQLQGHPRYNSDIYAVGIIGIQALTGLSTDHLSKNKIPLNSNNSNIGEISWRNGFKVSSKLADVLDKMVHFDFRKRYQSAKEVLAELRTITNSNLTPQYTTASATAHLSPQHIQQHPNWLIRWTIKFTIGILLLTVGLTVTFFAFAPRELVAIVFGGSKAIFFRDYQGAINDYNEAIKHNPKLAEAYILRGLARFALADNSGSIQDFNKVLQLQPNNAEIYNTRGIARGFNKEYQGSMGDKPPLALTQISTKL